MNSILEYMTITKSIGYLIAIGFLLAFVAYWQLVYGKGKGRGTLIAVTIYMVIGLMILAGSCVAMTSR